MFSFVIKIAKDVNKAVEEVKTIPMLGFINDIDDVEIADLDPFKTSLRINDIFFSSNYKFFFNEIHYQF